MPDQYNVTPLISVDMKKYRIRVHKATLHQLGDPSSLVNSEIIEISDFSKIDTSSNRASW